MRLSIILFITAILLGLGGGFALNRYAEKTLFDALDQEVRASTKCQLVSKTWDVSLLTLSAEARDAGIKCEDGTVQLLVPKITAGFNLKKIFNKKIVIDPLIIHGGKVTGIFPGSPSYEFIARLSASEPIEQKKEDKFRVRLEKLNVKNTELSHTFKSGAVLDVKKGELILTRASNDDVLLTPTLTNISINNSEFAETITANITTTDFDSFIKNITIKGPKINFDGNLDVQLTGAENLNGLGEARLSLPAIFPYASGIIQSSLNLSGSSKSDININSSFISKDAKFSDSPLSQLDGSLNMSFLESGEIHGTSDSISIQNGAIKNLKSIFSISKDDELSGNSKIQITQSNLLGISVSNGNLNLKLSGTTENPTFHLSGSLSDLSKNGITIPASNLEIEATKNDIKATLTSIDNSLRANFLSTEGKKESNFELNNFKLLSMISASGNGTFNLAKPGLIFNGKMLVGEKPLLVKADGELSKISAQISGEGVLATLTSNNDNAILKINAKDFLFSPCKSITTNLQYEFAISDPLRGSGELTPGSITPNCGAQSISLSPATSIPISNGALSLSGRKIAALNTDIDLNGSISLIDGLKVSFDGDAVLSDLLEGYTSFDEVGGKVTLHGKIDGPFDAPQIDGTIDVQEGAIEVETINVSAENINGKAKISNNVLISEDLSGILNGGTVRLVGEVPLSANDLSKAKIIFNDVSLEPSSEVSLVTSGDLSLQTDPTALTGTIIFDEGEVRKNFNLRSLIANTLASIFKREIQYTSQSNIDLPLNLSVEIPNSILIQTNLFEATLEGTLSVTGTISEPILKGKINFNDGWVGLRGRRFDINVGELNFSGDSAEPNLSVLAESVFLPSEQDSVSVVMQVEGPLSSPKVSLSSDRNLTNQQLLNIITGGTSETELTQINAKTGDSDLEDEFSLQDTVPFIPLPSFIRNLTRIDSLAIDPKYDPFTGQYEPVVTARKRLAPFLDLVGETSWQGTKNTAGVKAVYNLTQNINVVGLASSLPTEDSTVLGVDVTWTLLARQSSNTSISIRGNKALYERDILASMNISPFSVVYSENLPQATQKLINSYSNIGKRSAKISVSCKNESASVCKEVDVEIFEGSTSTISDIRFEGDPLPSGITLSTLDLKDIASNEILTSATQEIVNKLRNEGYVGAKVKSSYDCSENSCIAIFNIIVGRPISFIFIGNKKFTAGDFLSSIRLFTRKQPFGKNTAIILQENIETLYKSAGYPFVEVLREKSDDESGRIFYTFHIKEGISPSISEVFLDGYSDDFKKLLSRLADEVSDPYKETFGIKNVREETLNRAQYILTRSLILDGYENPDLIRSIEKNHDDSVNIRFKIQNITRKFSNTLTIDGYPFDLPEKPQPPFSNQSIDEYKAKLISELKSKGFNNAKAKVDFTSSNSTIHIMPGLQSKVEKISINGLENIEESTAKSALRLNSGDPISDTILREAQANLMKTGLFRKVNLSRDEGNINISVEERPLTTLEVGAGYSSGLGLHLFGEASDKKLFSDGKTISLRLDGYMDSWDGSLGQGIIATRFSEPSLFDSAWGLSSELSFQRQTLATYEFDLNRLSLGTYAYRSWESGLTCSAGYTALEENLKSVPTDAILSHLDSGSVILGYASGSITYDTRDYALNPSRGRIISIDSMISDNLLGSDAEYYGAGGRFTQYIPLTERVSFVAGGQAGKRWVFGNTEALPISQRYYLGGRGSVRGYKENSLGPRGDEGSIIGGDELLRGNVEFHYKLYDDVSLQTFFDVGKISIEGVESPLDSWAKGVGVGFRYISPIGPIGLDFGHGLDDIPGSRDFRMTFDIGVSF